MLKTIVLAAALAGLTCTVQAQQKMALVDLKRVFDSYYKTKQADVQLKERAADSDKVFRGMVDDFKKAEDDYKKMVEGANDQAVSSEERDKRKKNAEAKFAEMQDIDKSAQQFRRQTQATLEEQKRRMRDNILKDVRDVINAKAKAGNYNLVLDTAAESINLTPVVLFQTGNPEITEDVLAQLNAAAPAGFSADKTTEPSALSAPPKAAPVTTPAPAKKK